MKKIITKAVCLLCAGALVLGAAGCSKSADSSSAASSTAAAVYGSAEDYDYENFSYSSGLDENGYWEGVKALDYVTLPENFASLTFKRSEIEPTEEELQSEIDSYGYEIENIGNTFIIPLNLYSDKVKSVDELKDGDTVAIPDDATNGGRALKVLEAAGLIKLKDGADFNPTVDDIETYNKQIKIEELKANIIPSTLADVTAGVVNGNYALDFGLKTEDAIYKDDKLDIEEYWNLIAARTEDLSDPAKVETYRKVVAAFQSDETEAVFNDQFGGYFIKAGWDQDLLADK